MFENAYGLIELAFTFGLVLVFGVWQLISVAKTRQRLEEEQRKKQEER
jgi:hypothetical protein